MDSRSMIGPPDRGRGPRRWGGPLRRVLLIAAVLLIAVLGNALAAGRSEAPAAVAGQQAPPPGLQPPVQKWLKEREPLQIELNNALVPVVQQKIKDPGQAPRICSRILAASRAHMARPAAPDAQVDQLARAGLVKFEQGALACLTGDITSGLRLITEGLAERTAAQEPLDEVLEGE